MQKFIGKYSLAAHLAILAVAPLFLSPDWVLSLSAFGFLWMMMEPSRRADESLHVARARVWRTVVRDGLFWAFLVVIGVAAVRCLNDGVDMVYDAETTLWRLAEPAVPYLPGSVSGAGWVPFAALVATAVVVLGCRHALGKSARLMFWLLFAALSAAGFYALAALLPRGFEPAMRMMRCSRELPSYPGFVFGLAAMSATVALAGALAKGWLRALPVVFLSLSATVAGAFLFAPPLTALACAATEALLFAYSFVYARRNLANRGEFRFTVVFVFSLVLAGVLVVALAPEDLLSSRIAPWQTGDFLTRDFLTLRQELSKISTKAWLEDPWLGTGLGSFPLDVRFHATEEAWQYLSPDQVAPLNGYWHLLVERGIVGSVLVAVLLGFLLWAYAVRMIRGVRRMMPEPSAAAGLLTLLFAAVEMLTSVSALSPAALLALTSFLALSANSFPKEKAHV